MLELKEVELIKEIIKKRNIKWLCHFTPRENLEFIKRDGLQPRNLITHHYQVTDTGRFDRFKNSICLSISKPNKRMFDRKKESGLDLCLLLISPDVLFEKEFLFYPHNAATASYRYIDINAIRGSQALDNLFSPSISYQKSNLPPQTISRSNDLLDSETTSDQAEVQCLDVIEPKYIEYILDENIIPLEYKDILNYIESRKEKISELLGVISSTSRSKVPNYIDDISKEDSDSKAYNKNSKTFRNNSMPAVRGILMKSYNRELKQNKDNDILIKENVKKEENYKYNVKEKTKIDELHKYKKVDVSSSSSGDNLCISIIIIIIILSFLIL
ncbi:hypothetical protein C3007_03120 [Avibacterium gallinarum]|uniref:Uncharacterized protein DUF4433 n=1 Tax=Avibacterium gallinarum TaxID=755 RepID=A0A379AWF5_AVIGA|nr:DarT ssDNA thymidine ADP-ribosyltransferase family protein [Avibacterium gallinarum]POY44927.1 hypothetical protein C3007_03120 [Avibacterium gallinarum]TDP30090.1 uncharacterized protein DUF4433 [Avibacterium gallinarum]SUB26589.1 Uncharacterised protein [Avibacterium gallinarum]